MPVNLKGRSFLTLKDFTTEEIRYLLDLSRDLKAKKRAGIKGNLLFRKNVVLIFDKASTRTRCAFETAAWDEGGNATFLTNSQMGKKESVEDTAKVLGRMYDGIQYRGFSQKLVEDLAKYSGVSVWNGLTDEDHPTQILADLLTIEEHCLEAPRQVQARLLRRRAQQHGQRPHDRLRQDGHEVRRPRPQGAHAQREAHCRDEGRRREDRRQHRVLLDR
jgi:ornithine carbamoyltransferase